MNAMHNIQPTTESMFYEIGYLKQKIGLLLLGICLNSENEISLELVTRTEEALQEGGLDARVVLGLFGASIRQEIVESNTTGGVWVHNGIKKLIEEFLLSRSMSVVPNANSLIFLKSYLQGWRYKKGFGSTTDEVFATIDSALLRVLLLLESAASHNGPSASHDTSEARQELYTLVSAGVDNSQRAIEILEEFGRLYVLSRLYQRLKQPRDVLATWKRILAKGDGCEGGEFIDGEIKIKEYLCKLKDSSLLEEYGGWLARRNSKLGVQVQYHVHSIVFLTD